MRVDPVAAVGAALGVVGTALFVVDLATRPPCPDGYVRLLDLEPEAAVVCALLTLGLVWRLARTTRWVRRRKPVHTRTMVVSGVLAVLAAFLTAVTAGSLVEHAGAGLDSTCWTF